MSGIEEPDKTETVEKAEPETGNDDTTHTDEPDTAKKPDRSEDAEGLTDEAAKWRTLSRKNEAEKVENRKRAETAEAKTAEVESQLAAANARIARLEAQAAYPQISDEAFEALCKETTPDGIKAWAEAYSRINPVNVAAEPETGKPDESHTQSGDNPSPISQRVMSKGMPQPTPPAKGTEKSGYDYAVKHCAPNTNTKKE
ncbi:hypothetical protein [Bifidobacterium eulemuris]|uniref:Scaffolding protein n=1 Tax=Bifidobacterium eulemuris TaxID=1765219 RepID=A0A261GA11_9BIFI|nr:hypothetical protein [Bifidobacterium eulemuris]OZG68271.1 hypothetical protein BEUL_1284 [Bifidobacterium eulemuris]QOL31674.1 hypothetical protein BE0216_03755 [Bifidobacterium eulemuris]